MLIELILFLITLLLLQPRRPRLAVAGVLIGGLS